MDFLNNPIANMTGPSFLLLYSLICLSFLFFSWLALRRSDRSRELPPLPINSEPDPYKIAYLRGGEKEVVRVAIFDMVQRGFLLVHNGKVEQSPDAPSTRHLDGLQQLLFENISYPTSPDELTQTHRLLLEIQQFCKEFRRECVQERLLISGVSRQLSRSLKYVGLILFLGLAAYKIGVALSRGRSNVLILIILTIVWSVWLVSVTTLPRLSVRGKDFLDRLSLAFSQIQQRIQHGEIVEGDPDYLFAVGLFGTAVLAGTSFAMLHDLFYHPMAIGSTFDHIYMDSYNSCGSGCSGGCGSSCGGGCGGGCGGCGGCGG